MSSYEKPSKRTYDFEKMIKMHIGYGVVEYECCGTCFHNREDQRCTKWHPMTFTHSGLQTKCDFFKAIEEEPEN